MTRFEINLTLLTTVTIVAQDATAAAKEARNLPDLFHVPTTTLDGWNSIRREEGQPLTVDILPVYLEAEELEVVECARWVVQPQADLNADLSPDSGTRIEPCEEARATSWGVFEVDAAGCANSLLVEDYPSRAAAQAAVDALNMGDPLPTPVWPVAPVDMAQELATVLEALALAAADNGLGGEDQAGEAAARRLYAARRVAETTLARMGVKVEG